ATNWMRPPEAGWVRQFIGPLRNPAVLRAHGKKLRGGLLLYGRPGCGKTFIARATAGEIGARFVAIGLSDVLSMWLGESKRQRPAGSHVRALTKAALSWPRQDERPWPMKEAVGSSYAMRFVDDPERRAAPWRCGKITHHPSPGSPSACAACPPA